MVVGKQRGKPRPQLDYYFYNFRKAIPDMSPELAKLHMTGCLVVILAVLMGFSLCKMKVNPRSLACCIHRAERDAKWSSEVVR